MMKVLFIGNSATYMHDMPKTFAAMAASTGFSVEVDQLTYGGCVLSRYADENDPYGQDAREKIAAGHDIVFLQDNGNCISSPEMTEKCCEACRTLDKLILASGAKTYLYIRPPYGYEAHGHTREGQIEAFTELFGMLGKELSAPCAQAAKGFGYVLEHFPEVDPYWHDNAHASEAGSYLIACCCYIAVFGKLPEEIFEAGLAPDTAKKMRQAARAVSGLCP